VGVLGQPAPGGGGVVGVLGVDYEAQLGGKGLKAAVIHVDRLGEKRLGYFLPVRAHACAGVQPCGRYSTHKIQT
jgi:hypothetical protein